MLSMLLTLIVVLAVIGFACWVVVTYIPMPPAIQQALVGIVILLLLIWLVRWVLTTQPLLRGL